MQGLSCFGAIIPNREVKFICLPCLILALFCLLCFALFFFLCFALFCFACFLGVSRFLVGIILILVKCFSFFAFRVLYRIIPISHHISGKHLLLCLSVLMSKRMLCIRLFAPFISLYGNFWLWNPLKIRILRLVSIDVYLHLALKYMKLARLDNHIFV